MKKIIAFLLVMTMCLGMAACGSKNEEAAAPDTVGGFLLADFKANPEGSAQEIVDRVIVNEILPFECAYMDVEPGLLNGFDNAEITGFEKGVMFAPMMGTIPFLGYVFETADEAAAEALVQTLKDSANLRWNICTEAEELTVDSEGNIVFFLMSPKSFEE